MVPTNAKPSAGAEGGIERSGEQPTRALYSDYVSDRDWEAAVAAVFRVAGGDTERGERGRRALHALCTGPFIERALWTAAQSLAWVFVAAVLSGDDSLKARANALIKSVLALAAESRASLGRAA